MKNKRLSKPRIQVLDESDRDDELKALLERPSDFAGGRVLNIMNTMARHPKLYKRWSVFANHIILKSTLPPRERELLILRIGWLCKSEYEWGQHVIIGKQSGLTDDEIQRIKEGPESAGWNTFDATLLKAVDELHNNAFISDETWDALKERYNTHQLMDLVFTVGQYNMVSWALNTFGVQLDEGVKGF